MAGSKTILFIEDDRSISDMYARLLTKAGYKVDFAYDGTAGLEAAKARAYDLILLDIMMPGMTGIEVLGALRAWPSTAQAKVVVLTNLAQSKTSRQALGSEADAYLIKADIIPSQLTGIVANIIGS